jgi:beta-galactosidase
MLWDTETPLIRCRNALLLTKVVGSNRKLRWFEFVRSWPFYLNGKRLLIRGTHRHEEHAGVGAAMSNQQHRAMEAIKKWELICSIGTLSARS